MTTEAIQKFSTGIDEAYCRRMEEYSVQDLGRERPTWYLVEDAREKGITPDGEAVKHWEDYWLKSLKLQPWEQKRTQRVKRFAQEWAVLKDLWEATSRKSGGLIQFENNDLDSVHKAFTTNGMQTLFPFMFDTNIQAGILASPALERLITDSRPVNSHTITHLEMTEVAADVQMAVSGEGAQPVAFRLVTRERTINLTKFMGQLDITYEAMRMQRMNFLQQALTRIGQRFALHKTDMALAALIDGDGSTPSNAITDVPFAGDHYTSLVAMEMDFPVGYTPDTILAPKGVITDLLNLAEYKDPLAGILHQTTGRMPNPLGMDLLRWDSTGKVTTYADTNVIMFDSNLSLTEYTEGGLIIESERVIRSQWETSVTSQWVGYGKWDAQAARRGTGF